MFCHMPGGVLRSGRLPAVDDFGQTARRRSSAGLREACRSLRGKGDGGGGSGDGRLGEGMPGGVGEGCCCSARFPCP